MSLLEIILRSAGAFEYLETFENEGIDARSLKILSDEDLTDMGIDDKEIKDKLLQCIQKYQIPSEKHVDMTFDKEYVDNCLSHIIRQMVLYNATFTPMAITSNISNVTIPLQNACATLSSAIDDLHQEILVFKKHVLENKNLSQERRKKKKFLVPGFLFSVFMATNVFILRKVITIIQQ